MSLNEIIVKADSIGDPVIEATTEKFGADPNREKAIKQGQIKSLQEDLEGVTSITEFVGRVAKRHPLRAATLAILAVIIAFGPGWYEVLLPSKSDVNIHIYVNGHEVAKTILEQLENHGQEPEAEELETSPKHLRSR